MAEAVSLALQSVVQGGGPFGAVVVCSGEIVGRGHNRVTLDNDPTAHAEIEAIREACANRADFHLPDCDLYTSSMPCPMCLSAAYWAKLSRVFYAVPSEEAAAVGFLDEFLFKELSLPTEQRSLPLIHMHDESASEVFREWIAAQNRVDY